MKKTVNRTHIEGLLYQHDLKVKVSGAQSNNPGVTFISGNVEIATDNALTNIVPVHFTYVTATTSKGNPNNTFTVLNDIISGKHGSVMGSGEENAVKLRIDSAIGLNEFFADRNGKEELVSAKRNEGGFVHVINFLAEDEKTRNTFETDIIISKVTLKEADEEQNLPEKAIVTGHIFDYRNALLPVEFSVINPNAINYFVGLEASEKNPVFTKVSGRQVAETVVKVFKEESAFGEDRVREVKNTRKDFVITWAAHDPYVWDDESSITVKELNDLLAAREVTIATIKKRQDDYKASKATSAPAAAPSAAPAMGGFEF